MTTSIKGREGAEEWVYFFFRFPTGLLLFKEDKRV